MNQSFNHFEKKYYCYSDIEEEEVYCEHVQLQSDPCAPPYPPSLAYLCHFLMPEADLRYWAQHIKARALCPKLEMKNTERIQIAVDQMNGWGIFRALSHSVCLDLAPVTKAQSVDYGLPAMSLAAVETGTSHSHIKY